MRGTPARSRPPRAGSGIIPALAGNTPSMVCVDVAAWDHPRACGEHEAAIRARITQVGSSPRLRGTHAEGISSGDARGIIPALAGNTCTPVAHQLHPWDHPRACGEHLLRLRFCYGILGSSPRLRGTRNNERHFLVCPGIIPALAGNTACNEARHSCYWDHPRACGEHLFLMRFSALYLGSSPRLRGTPAFGELDALQ